MGRSFWRYFVAQAVSILGTHIGRFALGLLVYELTGSAAAMGALYIISAVPENLLRLLGGPLIDRLPRVKLMASLDLVRGLTYIIPWLFFRTGHPTIWVLYLLSFVGGSANALYSPATMAVIPTLVPANKLQKANSLLWTVVQVFNVVGPMVAVAVCAFLGNANALIVDGISFAICGLVLTFTVKHPVTTPASTQSGSNSYTAQLMEGFAVYRQIPALLTITVVLAISNIGSIGSMTMLIPMVRQHLAAPNPLLGSIETGFAVGALAASLLASSFVLRLKRRFLMLSGLLFIQIAQIISAILTPNLAFIMVGAWILYGFGMSIYSIHSQTIYQQLVPDHLRGRVMSVRMLVAQGLGPIGQFIGTLIATQWGPATTFLVGGGVPFIITLCALFFPSLQALDQIGMKPTETESVKHGTPTPTASSSQ